MSGSSVPKRRIDRRAWPDTNRCLEATPMSTVEQRPPATIPPLMAGQRLGQAEFLRRYEATPPGFKAELIGGVVHVPSPVGGPHGRGSFWTSTWLGVYCARTPGVEGLDNATTVIDRKSVV
jgi:hypothetical protein